MPSFDTPEPISLNIVLAAGHARITASERADTVVDVRPSNPSRKADVKAAEQTRVEFSNGNLLVKAPKPFGRGGSVDVSIDLPTGSRVHGDAAWAEMRCDGRLGDCRFSTAASGVRLDETAALHVDSAHGAVSVGKTVGHTKITAASGDVRIGEVDGPAVIKNASGATWIGAVTGDIRVTTASGGITVDRAEASVVATTAHGSVRIGDVGRGSAVLETSSGEVEVGIRAGTAAWLDVSTRYGNVHNYLTASDSPEQTDDTVEVRARSSYGDVVIRRA